MTDKEKIQNMREGDTIFVDMYEEGGAQIHRYNYQWILYEIPQYGGSPSFCGIFNDVDKLIETYEGWT